MRIRHKPWAKPELEACNFYVKLPADQKGRWTELFKEPDRPLYVELGCGKGGFISQAAPAHPEVNFIAMDIKNEMLVLAKRKLELAFEALGRTPDNVRVAIQNIERLDLAWDENDRADRIYINFCNPWPKAKHHKHRLTHTRQLEKYKTFLKDGGEIRFKTDSDILFKSSVRYFEEAGFEITYITEDLHNSGFEGNIETEHEKMFTAEGITTKFLIAKYNKK